MEIRSIKEIYNFRQSSVVSVPIVAKVDNTLVSRLRWVTSSYVSRLDTKTTSSRSACLKYLGLAILWYVYGSTNLVGRLGCVTSRGRCAFVSPASLPWTPKISIQEWRPLRGVRA
jgi:hypothetical protein